MPKPLGSLLLVNETPYRLAIGSLLGILIHSLLELIELPKLDCR